MLTQKYYNGKYINKYSLFLFYLTLFKKKLCRLSLMIFGSGLIAYICIYRCKIYRDGFIKQELMRGSSLVIQDQSVDSEVNYILDIWDEEMDLKSYRFPWNITAKSSEIHDEDEYESWSPIYLKSLLDSPTRKCRRLVSVGGRYDCHSCQHCSKDGHKYVCLDNDIRPHPGDCIVYSFGIGENLSFDEGIAKFNCSVFAFEIEQNFTNQILKKNIHMLHLGLFDKNAEVAFTMRDERDNKTWLLPASMRTFDTIIDILDHNDREIDYLKMDIEFSEWLFFEYMFGKRELSNIFNRINQIGLEIHLDDFKNKSTTQRIKGGKRYEKVLNKLKESNYHLAVTELNTFSQYFSAILGTVIPVFRESLYIKSFGKLPNRSTHTGKREWKWRNSMIT